ncbi:MMPL family transporter [Streptomyces alfalfae]|nr:MMPL family transporter [Streptomyces alfalfae]AYA17525.1 MMPL family transporter [Streptomyces fradiae]QUI33091.1 MMPL family transporter [Streptomyces alfalfae]RXX44735.1 MMPL family transporter [Streptomyces alfalfae]RZM95470.1 MMPL family transporter [Streptomyces alfalfae]
MGSKNLITRMARWSATHPWWAITLWVVFVIGALAAGSATGTQRATNADLAIGQSGRAAEIAKSGGLEDRAVENILVTPYEGRKFDREAAGRAAEAAVAELRDVEGIASIGDPVPAPNGSALVVPVVLKGDPETADTRVQPLVDGVAAAQKEHDDVRVELVGAGSIKAGLNEMLNEDLGKATVLSLPVTLLVMVFVFGAIVAAGVPVLLGLSAVLAGLGLWGVASQLVPDPGPVTHIIVLMGMAIGVDYSLFYLKRQREERALGSNNVDAIEIAAATSGHAVMVSGLVVMVSMGALYLAGHVAFESMATGAVLVVAIAMVASLTALPALLSKFGRFLDKPRVPLVWRLTARSGKPRLWSAMLKPSLRHPVISLVVSVGALLALALPALDLKLKATGIDDLPRSIPAMQANDRLVQSFPSQADTHTVAVKVPEGERDRLTAAMAGLVERAGKDSLFTRTPEPEVRVSKDGTIATVAIGTRFNSSSPDAQKSLARLRDDIAPQTVGAVPGAEFAVGGSDVAYDVDYRANVVEKMPWVLGIALALTFLVMAIAFRSVMLALITVVLNVLSAVASFGLLALIFQRTWAEGILDFESTGRVVAWLPLMLFVILLGLSMDYHVFVVSRIREAARGGLGVREAVEQGITRTAGVVTSAAVVMVSVFALLASLNFIEMKQMGVGMACAVLLDATLIRIVVLPSVVTLLGWKTWWPSRLAHQDDTRPVRVPAAARVGAMAETK